MMLKAYFLKIVNSSIFRAFLNNILEMDYTFLGKQCGLCNSCLILSQDGFGIFIFKHVLEKHQLHI